nr:3484_t:CDS:2 [Entrophospora candida]
MSSDGSIFDTTKNFLQMWMALKEEDRANNITVELADELLTKWVTIYSTLLLL